MNKLGLSSKHKKMLLEISNDLFTEFKKVEIDEFHGNYFLLFDDKVKLHWFEVCIMEIPERIAKTLNSVYPKERHSFIVDMMIKKMLKFSNLEKKHPVDFLYDIYKKQLNNE